MVQWSLINDVETTHALQLGMQESPHCQGRLFSKGQNNVWTIVSWIQWIMQFMHCLYSSSHSVQVEQAQSLFLSGACPSGRVPNCSWSEIFCTCYIGQRTCVWNAFIRLPPHGVAYRQWSKTGQCEGQELHQPVQKVGSHLLDCTQLANIFNLCFQKTNKQTEKKNALIVQPSLPGTCSNIINLFYHTSNSR